MSEKKTILFNDSFMTANKTRKNPKEKKQKPKAIIKPSTLKKTLLEKIKKHQQHEKISKKVDENIQNNEDINFHNNFIDSLDYLNKLGEKNKKKKKVKKNKTVKNPIQNGGKHTSSNMNMNMNMNNLISVDLPTDFDNSSTPIHLSSIIKTPPIPRSQPTIQPTIPTPQPTVQPLPIVQPQPPIQPQPTIQRPTNIGNVNKTIIPNDPPYSCLKGGNKPTYRQYHNKTLKNKHSTNKISNKSSSSIRQQKLSQSQKSCQKIRQKKRNIKKTTFKLGKKGRKVSVLIKNNTTRRKIKKEHGLLKQKSINEIKNYLYEKNLIKIGSTAPNDILRTLYEQSILAGDITNIGGNISVHNYLNEK